MEFDQEIISIYDKNVLNQEKQDESSLINRGIIKKATNYIKTIKNVLFNNF